MTLQAAVGTPKPDREGSGVLAAHLQFCTASMGKGFGMICLAEAVHSFVAPRFVTTIFFSSVLLFSAMLTF